MEGAGGNNPDDDAKKMMEAICAQGLEDEFALLAATKLAELDMLKAQHDQAMAAIPTQRALEKDLRMDGAHTLEHVASVLDKDGSHRRQGTPVGKLLDEAHRVVEAKRYERKFESPWVWERESQIVERLHKAMVENTSKLFDYDTRADEILVNLRKTLSRAAEELAAEERRARAEAQAAQAAALAERADILRSMTMMTGLPSVSSPVPVHERQDQLETHRQRIKDMDEFCERMAVHKRTPKEYIEGQLRYVLVAITTLLSGHSMSFSEHEIATAASLSDEQTDVIVLGKFDGRLATLMYDHIRLFQQFAHQEGCGAAKKRTQNKRTAAVYGGAVKAALTAILKFFLSELSCPGMIETRCDPDLYDRMQGNLIHYKVAHALREEGVFTAAEEQVVRTYLNRQAMKCVEEQALHVLAHVLYDMPAFFGAYLAHVDPRKKAGEGWPLYDQHTLLMLARKQLRQRFPQKYEDAHNLVCGAARTLRTEPCDQLGLYNAVRKQKDAGAEKHALMLKKQCFEVWAPTNNGGGCLFAVEHLGAIVANKGTSLAGNDVRKVAQLIGHNVHQPMFGFNANIFRDWKQEDQLTAEVEQFRRRLLRRRHICSPSVSAFSQRAVKATMHGGDAYKAIEEVVPVPVAFPGTDVGLAAKCFGSLGAPFPEGEECFEREQAQAMGAAGGVTAADSRLADSGPPLFGTAATASAPALPALPALPAAPAPAPAPALPAVFSLPSSASLDCCLFVAKKEGAS